MPRLLDLTNKTPFANHTIPESPSGSAFESPLKAPFKHRADADAPETVLRPSRARTSVRLPRISGGSTCGGLPPVTPAPEGRRPHWEIVNDGEDASIGEMTVDDIEGPSMPLDDEVEYMPPPIVGEYK